MHHNVRRSEEGPLTQQSNLDDGDNNTTTTKRTKMSNSRSGRVERIRGRKRRRQGAWRIIDDDKLIFTLPI